MAFCYVGDTDEEALRIGQKIAWFLTVSMKSAPQMSKFQPGQIPPEMAPAAWRGGALERPTDLSVPSVDRAGPDVRRQPGHGGAADQGVPPRVGGVGRLIMMTRQGLVTHEEAEKSFSLTAREVLPQLQDLEPLDEAAPLAAGAGA